MLVRKPSLGADTGAPDDPSVGLSFGAGNEFPKALALEYLDLKLAFPKAVSQEHGPTTRNWCLRDPSLVGADAGAPDEPSVGVEALGSGSEVSEGSCTGEFDPLDTGAIVGAGLDPSLGGLGVGADPPPLGGVGLGMDMLKLPSR